MNKVQYEYSMMMVTLAYLAYLRHRGFGERSHDDVELLLEHLGVQDVNRHVFNSV